MPMLILGWLPLSSFSHENKCERFKGSRMMNIVSNHFPLCVANTAQTTAKKQP